VIPLALGISGLLLIHLYYLYRSRPDRFFTPSAFLVASGILYTLPASLARVLGAPFPGLRMARLGLSDVDVAILLSAVFTLVLSVSALVRPAVRIPLRGLAPAARPIHAGLLWGGALTGLAGGILVAILLARLGGPRELANIDYGARFLELRGQGPLRLGVDLLTLASITAGLHTFSIGRRYRLTAVLLLGLASFAVAGWYVLSGIRGPLFRLLIGLGIIWSLRRAPIRPVVLASATITLVAMSSLLGHWRASGTLIGATPGVLNPARGEFVAPVLTTADVLREQAALGGMRFGSTYVEAVGGLLPGALGFGRPIAPSVEYARSLYADFWYRGGAFAFSPVAEAVLNFGVPGVFLVPIAIGMLLSLRIRREDAGGLDDVFVLAMAFGLPWVLQFFRMDAASAVRAAMYNWALPLVALLFMSGLVGLASGPPRSRTQVHLDVER
jgi:hypothetical protein